MKNDLTLIFSTPVWGKNYIDIFLKYSLPTYLDDIELLAKEGVNIIFNIYTNRNDISYFEKNNNFKILLNNTKLKYYWIEKIFTSNKLDKLNKMTVCHNHSIDILNKIENESGIVFNTADAVYSKDLFKKLYLNWKEEDKKIFFLSTIRVDLNKMKNNLNFKAKFLKNICIKGAFEKHIRPSFNNLLINKNPSYIFWFINRDNFLLKSFHLHPVVVFKSINKKISSIPKNGTSDGCYTNFINNIDIKKDIKIFNNLDETIMFGVEKFKLKKPNQYYNYNYIYLASWMKKFTSPLCRKNFKRSIFLYLSDESISESEIKKNIKLFEKELSKALNFFEKGILFDNWEEAQREIVNNQFKDFNPFWEIYNKAVKIGYKNQIDHLNSPLELIKEFNEIGKFLNAKGGGDIFELINPLKYIKRINLKIKELQKQDIRKVTLYGCGDFCKIFIFLVNYFKHNFTIDIIIDDFLELEEYEGIKIIKINEISKKNFLKGIDAIIICAERKENINSIYKKLKSNKNKHKIITDFFVFENKHE